MSAEHTFEETLLKLSFRKFTGGPKGSGTPESRVNMQSPNKSAEDPAQAAGIGAGHDLAPPMADNKNLARSLGSYNRVLKRAPAPASTGMTVTASVAPGQPQQATGRRKLTKQEAALAIALGGGVGTVGAKMLLPMLSRRIRQMPRSRRLLAALGMGVGGAGLGLLGAKLDRKYGYHPKKEDS